MEGIKDQLFISTITNSTEERAADSHSVSQKVLNAIPNLSLSSISPPLGSH